MLFAFASNPGPSTALPGYETVVSHLTTDVDGTVAQRGLCRRESELHPPRLRPRRVFCVCGYSSARWDDGSSHPVSREPGRSVAQRRLCLANH